MSQLAEQLATVEELEKQQAPTLRVLQGGHGSYSASLERSTRAKKVRNWTKLAVLAVFVVAIALSATRYYLRAKSMAMPKTATAADQKWLEWQKIGIDAFQQKRYDVALEYFQQVENQFPQDADVLSNVALAFKFTKNYAQAKKYFEQAKSLDTQNPAIYNNLGTLHFELGELADAELAFLQAFKIRANYLPVLLNLAKLYEHRQEWAAAEKYYSIYIEQNGTDADTVKKIKSRIRRLHSLVLVNGQRGDRI